MRYLIIDDEPLAHDLMRSYADTFPELSLAGRAYSAPEALHLLKAKSVDLLFLDIRMPKLNGIDLLTTLKQAPLTIITSAFEEYALEGYELDVVDYLLKPFSLKRFVKGVNKAYDRWTTPRGNVQPAKGTAAAPASFFIKANKTIYQIYLQDILYLESIGGYVKIHLPDRMIVTNRPLQNFEAALGRGFVRIHKSFLVSIAKIECIEGQRVRIADIKLPIGRHYKKDLIGSLKL